MPFQMTHEAMDRHGKGLLATSSFLTQYAFNSNVEQQIEWVWFWYNAIRISPMAIMIPDVGFVSTWNMWFADSRLFYAGFEDSWIALCKRKLDILKDPRGFAQKTDKFSNISMGGVTHPLGSGDFDVKVQLSLQEISSMTFELLAA